jgi:hypothetical protein
MNIPETEIENLLRAAPKPAPPAGLKERLVAEMQLPPTRTKPSRPVMGHPRGGWLRRWWPTLAPATVSLACAVVFTMQQLEVNDLKETIRVLSPGAVATEATPSTAQAPTADTVSAVDASASEQAEITRLKTVASQLTAAIAQLERIRAENQKLRDRITAPPANGFTSEEIEEFAKAHELAASLNCVNNLKQLGLASKVWALDNNDKFPEDILSMTNEMSTPKILWCPGDEAHQPAKGWADFTTANCSYEYLAPSASDDVPERVLFRCPIHGNIGLCDGSVQKGVGKTHPEQLVTRDGKLYLEYAAPPARSAAPLNNANP